MTRGLDEFSTPTPTSVRIVRTFDAPVPLVWQAHTESDLVRQWATGPPGHTLAVCEIDFRVGGSARYVWANPDFEMGMTAEFLEIAEHDRIVYAERYDAWPQGNSTVTASFSEHERGTQLTLTIEFASQEARDAAIQPGYADGFAASYANLDALVAEVGAG